MFDVFQLHDLLTAGKLLLRSQDDGKPFVLRLWFHTLLLNLTSALFTHTVQLPFSQLMPTLWFDEPVVIYVALLDPRRWRREGGCAAGGCTNSPTPSTVYPAHPRLEEGDPAEFGSRGF